MHVIDNIPDVRREQKVRVPAVLQGGFRLFFLLAGLQASGFLALWIAGWLIGLPVLAAGNAVLWHGHALVFGFGSAALAGFLLTAVPSWTGSTPVRGWKLAALGLLWLAARLLALWPVAIESGVYGAADLAFWPTLAALVLPGIIRRNVRRNGFFVVILTAFAACDAIIQLDLAGRIYDWGQPALYAGLGLFVILIGIIGGRIVPAFTTGGLRMAGRPATLLPHPWLDRAALTAIILAFIAELADVAPHIQAELFLLAAALHGLRFVSWKFWLTWRIPLIWSLHAGYAWLVAGLLLKALAAADHVPEAAAIHALGAGCVGSMVLAVMTRAALGHTGRKLEAPVTARLAYLLVNAGALIRVVAALAPGADAWLLQLIAGIAWSMGFIVFVAGYAGILTGPRIDGRPG